MGIFGFNGLSGKNSIRLCSGKTGVRGHIRLSPLETITFSRHLAFSGPVGKVWSGYKKYMTDKQYNYENGPSRGNSLVKLF